jgi:carbon-monoxide dehydrogenase medium subunit
MKTLKEFTYVIPQTLVEAASLLAQDKEQTTVIAGGTDLIPLMKERVITPNSIIDLKAIPALDFVRWDDQDGLVIGSLTKISTILESDVIKEKYFCLHEAAESFGTTQVRNMATIGGNICRSSPSADTVPPLLAFDAMVKLVGPEGEREARLEDFFTGPGENILAGEILAEIKLAPPKGPCGSAFKKLARTAEDLSKANCAVRIVMANGTFEDVGIALGGVAQTPVRAKKVEEALRGQQASAGVIEKAIENATKDISPITDVRSTAEYRTYISKLLIKRLVDESMARIGGK